MLDIPVRLFLAAQDDMRVPAGGPGLAKPQQRALQGIVLAPLPLEAVPHQNRLHALALRQETPDGTGPYIVVNQVTTFFQGPAGRAIGCPDFAQVFALRRLDIQDTDIPVKTDAIRIAFTTDRHFITLGCQRHRKMKHPILDAPDGKNIPAAYEEQFHSEPFFSRASPPLRGEADSHESPPLRGEPNKRPSCSFSIHAPTCIG